MNHKYVVQAVACWCTCMRVYMFERVERNGIGGLKAASKKGRLRPRPASIKRPSEQSWVDGQPSRTESSPLGYWTRNSLRLLRPYSSTLVRPIGFFWIEIAPPRFNLGFTGFPVVEYNCTPWMTRVTSVLSRLSY